MCLVSRVGAAEVWVSVRGRRLRRSSEKTAHALLLAQQGQLQLPAGTALVPHTYVTDFNNRPRARGLVSGSIMSVCLCSGCDAEPQCSVSDLRDADVAGFFSCSLYPDSRVCGAYDKPLRRRCRPLLDRAPDNTYSKKGKEWGRCCLVHFRLKGETRVLKGP